jgi:hypothetical protein
MLLGKKITEGNVTRLQNIEKPLKILFDPIKISQEALDVSLNDIKLYSKNKKNQK